MGSSRLVRASKPGMGWRSRRALDRRNMVPEVRSVWAPGFIGLFGEFLIITGGFVAVMIISIPFNSSRTAYAMATYLPVAPAVGLGIIAVRLASSTRRPPWVWTAFALTAFNMFVLPAIVTVVLKVPADVGMPVLLVAYWSAVASVTFLLAILLNIVEPKTAAAIVLGGGVGLAGFALFVTQLGIVSQGYTSIVPFATQAGGAGLHMLPDSELVLRFDDSYVQVAYLERGVRSITRPVYYHHVDYTLISGVAPNIKKVSGKLENDSAQTYFQAMQGLVTFGLAKPYDSQLEVRAGS